jgi:hypothetical protein
MKRAVLIKIVEGIGLLIIIGALIQCARQFR